MRSKQNSKSGNQGELIAEMSIACSVSWHKIHAFPVKCDAKKNQQQQQDQPTKSCDLNWSLFCVFVPLSSPNNYSSLVSVSTRSRRSYRFCRGDLDNSNKTKRLSKTDRFFLCDRCGAAQAFTMHCDSDSERSLSVMGLWPQNNSTNFSKLCIVRV